MPVVTVTLIEGYDEETRKALARRLTDAVIATIDAAPDGTTVIVNEVSRAGYMRGRELKNPGPPPPPPASVALDFLRAMEVRDIEKAKALVADDFRMIFPGGAEMSDLAQLAEWSKERYRGVTKRFERVDEAPAEDGVIVYCHGTLAGEWLDGGSFEGIRFIDRFTVKSGRIRDQRVWNDMGEVLRQRASG